MITEGSENGAVINFGLPYDSSIYQKPDQIDILVQELEDF